MANKESWKFVIDQRKQTTEKYLKNFHKYSLKNDYTHASIHCQEILINIMLYELLISSMIVSYLDSSINKRRLATVNKLLELKYYAKIMTERIIKNN